MKFSYRVVSPLTVIVLSHRSQLLFVAPPGECNQLSSVPSERNQYFGGNIQEQIADVCALVPFCPPQFNVTHCLYLYDYL